MKVLKSLLLLILALILSPIFKVVFFIINSIRFRDKLANYYYTLAISEDQSAGSYIYGTEDWTISSYTYMLANFSKNKNAIKFMRFIDFLFGKKHCENSYINECNGFNDNTRN